MSNQMYILDLHANHSEWLRVLDFYKDELQILTGRLSEVSAKNTKADIKVKVEQFQNRFIIQKETLDIIRHDIKAEEQLLQAEIKSNPVAVDHRKMEDNEPLRDRIEIFVKLFEELKDEFSSFAAELM
jgi:D-ribose pyranose/furanose isomerase RbsD